MRMAKVAWAMYHSGQSSFLKKLSWMPFLSMTGKLPTTMQFKLGPSLGKAQRPTEHQYYIYMRTITIR